MLVGLLAPACSPAIGGLLVEAFSWRWVFFASLPVALLTFVLAVRWLNDTPGPVRPTRFLPLSLLADPLLRFAMLIYLCVPGMFIGVNVVGMYYLQRVTGMAPGAIGALMVPWSLASFAAITFTGRYFNRFGPRPLVVIGCLLQAMGIMLLLKIDAGSPLAYAAAPRKAALSCIRLPKRCLTPARYGILTASSASLPAAPCSPCC